MKRLTIKQKKLLTKWHEESGNRQIFKGRLHYNFKIEDLTDVQWEILTSISNFEMMSFHVDKFLDGKKEVN
jgi:hypothetical protein